MQYRARVYDDYSAKFQRCSACGAMNKLGRTAGGGQFTPGTTVVDSYTVTAGNTTKNFYDVAAQDQANGCWACGCPAWNNGGKLGAQRH